MAPEAYTQEFIEMASRCSQEIKDLRGVISRLQPKAEAYDAMCTVLGLLPQRSQAMSEDLAWRLDRRISELKSTLEKQKSDAPAGSQEGDPA